MKIVYVTDAFAVWGGMERVLADKMNYLIEHYEYEISLLTVNQGDHIVPYDLNPNVLHIDLGIRMHQQYNYHGIRRIRRIYELSRLQKMRIKECICNIKPDIIICVKFDFVGVLLDVKGDVPLIIESHTLCKSEYIDGSGWLRKFHVWLWKLKICKANAVVTLTESDAREWENINSHVHVIPNVAHINESGHYSNLQEKSVIYVGRFSYQKDIESLLRIWQLVHQRHSDWQLNIYGDGEMKEHYISIIKRLNANINVYDPTPTIMECYFQNSILLLTSLYEPFGLVLPEAMSCGLPVVAFDCPYGPSSIIVDKENGFLIKNRNIDDFVDTICILIENYQLRKRIGMSAIISAKHFSANNIMPLWQKLFNYYK